MYVGQTNSLRINNKHCCLRPFCDIINQIANKVQSGRRRYLHSLKQEERTEVLKVAVGISRYTSIKDSFVALGRSLRWITVYLPTNRGYSLEIYLRATNCRTIVRQYVEVNTVLYTTISENQGCLKRFRHYYLVGIDVPLQYLPSEGAEYSRDK